MIAALQMTSCADVKRNLATAMQLIEQAAIAGAKLIVLPENFAFMGANETDKFAVSETFGNGLIQEFLAQQAKQYNIWLVSGSIPLQSENPQKVYNTCIVYNAEGKVAARYDKIHLFDAQVKPDVEVYEESKTIMAGNKIVVVDTPYGKLGLAICYDVRFPELFRELLTQGAQIIAIPIAFTVKTGQAH